MAFMDGGKSRPARLHGSPESLPHHAPTPAQCQSIFFDDRDNFKRFESWHASRRQAILKDRYRASREALFRAVREPAKEQVDTIVVTRQYQVLAVDDETSQVFLDSTPANRGVSFGLCLRPACLRRLLKETPAQLQGRFKFVKVMNLSSSKRFLKQLICCMGSSSNFGRCVVSAVLVCH